MSQSVYDITKRMMNKMNYLSSNVQDYIDIKTELEKDKHNEYEEDIAEKMLKKQETYFDRLNELHMKMKFIIESEESFKQLFDEFGRLMNGYFDECKEAKETVGNEINDLLDKIEEIEKKVKRNNYAIYSSKYQKEVYEDYKVDTEKYKKELEEKRQKEEEERKSRAEESKRILEIQKRMTSEIKVIVVGDQSSAKTTLLVTYTTNCFPDTYVPTVFDGFSAPISVYGKQIQMNFWDESGSDDLDEMRPLSYSETDCFMVCFSVADEESFEKIKTKWVPEIRQHCGEDKPRIVLVGTKCDLRCYEEEGSLYKGKEIKCVSKERIEKMKREVGACAACECSCITQSGLNELFETVAKFGSGAHGIDDLVEEETPMRIPSPVKPKKGLFTRLFGNKK